MRYSRIESIGITCCAGRTGELYQKLIAKEVNSLTLDNTLSYDNEAFYVGKILFDLPQIPTNKYKTRNNQILLDAYLQIEQEVKEAINRYRADRIGIIIGGSTAGTIETEEAFIEKKDSGHFPPNYALTKQELGDAPEFLANYSGIKGIRYGISTACSSSAKALASAKMLIDMGLCDAVIAGGVDTLCRVVVQGFHSLEVLSKGISNPFSSSRDGINLGEGAALFLMTKEDGGVQLAGFGESSDAYHISSPDPEGNGIKKSIYAALQSANCTPDQISYINLHGTGTIGNDSAESRAVKDVFGSDVFCSSTKPMTGHTLGAAGALEAAFCFLSLINAKERVYLPVHHYIENDIKKSDLSQVRLVNFGDSIEKKEKISFLTNSFAFGGNNCSLILSI